jgi:hypothetical protein
MGSDFKILQKLITEAGKLQMQVDDYLEHIQNTYEIHKLMLSSPSDMLIRIVNQTCDCGYETPKPLEPLKHPKMCSYARLYRL